MNRAAVLAGGVAFVIFAVIYLVISAGTSGIGVTQIVVAVLGGVVLGVVGWAIGLVVARRSRGGA